MGTISAVIHQDVGVSTVIHHGVEEDVVCEKMPVIHHYDKDVGVDSEPVEPVIHREKSSSIDVKPKLVIHPGSFQNAKINFKGKQGIVGKKR